MKCSQFFGYLNFRAKMYLTCSSSQFSSARFFERTIYSKVSGERFAGNVVTFGLIFDHCAKLMEGDTQHSSFENYAFLQYCNKTH